MGFRYSEFWCKCKVTIFRSILDYFSLKLICKGPLSSKMLPSAIAAAFTEVMWAMLPCKQIVNIVLLTSVSSINGVQILLYT